MNNNQDEHHNELQIENSAQIENKLIAQRRQKLNDIRNSIGDDCRSAFPNDFIPNSDAATLIENYENSDNDALENTKVLQIGGRIMNKRVMGKASFIHIQDGSGKKIQLYIARDQISAAKYQQFKNWDIGDIVGATGKLFKTRTEELTINVSDIRLLTKSLRPLPEKFHGLSDLEIRYRQRYLDLIVNPDSRRIFVLRSKIISFIRNFFEKRAFLEVETPMMHPIPGGAAARPFITHHNSLDMELYLRIAPELYLKRLIVGGFDRVFEINRNFRNEGISTRHNPEFTMLEFYQAYANYNNLMDLSEQLLRELSNEVIGATQINYQQQSIDFGAPFARLPMNDAIVKYAPQYQEILNDHVKLQQLLTNEFKIAAAANAPLQQLQTILFEETIEQQLIQPTFITDYPAIVSPLSRRRDDKPELAERFELFIAGREIANGFSELNDPEDQAQRFKEQTIAKDAGNLEAMYYDDDYIRALEYGLPPTAGEGIGIDRLVMLFTNSASIRDVLLFPLLRKSS